MSCKQMPDAGGNIIITHNTFFMLLAVKHVFVKAQEKMKKKLFFSKYNRIYSIPWGFYAIFT